MKNRDKYLGFCKKYRDTHKKEIKQHKKEYSEKNIEKIKLYRRVYNQSEYGKSIIATYKKRNIKKLRKNHSAYCKKWLKQNPDKKISHQISVGINTSIKNGKNGLHWESLVNYSLKDLMGHLEEQFDANMSWDNYGEWHIDHIIPISAFNFKTCEHEDFKRCWDLKNLQPLWKNENLSKKDKLEKPFQPNLLLEI